MIVIEASIAFPSSFSVASPFLNIHALVGEIKSALNLHSSEFQSKYGTSKPSKNNENVVFYCRAGVRSGQALAAAQSLGYINARNFKGSWLEWLAQSQAPK